MVRGPGDLEFWLATVFPHACVVKKQDGASSPAFRLHSLALCAAVLVPLRSRQLQAGRRRGLSHCKTL